RWTTCPELVYHESIEGSKGDKLHVTSAALSSSKGNKFFQRYFPKSTATATVTFFPIVKS
ncbi:MAG: hypothetical protein ACKPAD_07605, partial [Bacteroidota bacterium]